LNIGKIWAIGFLLVFMAILAPIAITQFNSGNELSHFESFVAENDDETAEVITLGHKPVKPLSEIVIVEDATATLDTDYGINNLTGVITLATDTSDTADAITVSYIEAVDFGGLGPLWLLIPTIVLLGILFKLYKSKGA
jgi:hypothetical protein